ncbi:DNA-binding response regulator [Cohnella endophytica]|uniref:DNA-binding response regulator n=1 Tax=Cohnella endophytica TaxID=2419778 RepID=A0A494XQU3_9BACL|nr:response regulator transcription factor [Cohnella endophytica]RKP49893.1 DNA-binding response regulator [Cohnella endophytica]
MGKEKILIADDDMDIILLLRKTLESEGYLTTYAMNGNEAIMKANDPELSLILLDIVMPDQNGLNVCRRIRDDISVPIIFLSAKDREIDKIIGLELGADDYITKPFSVDEVIARVKSHLRRETRKKKEIDKNAMLQSGKLTLNKDTYDVIVDDRKIILSTKEFQILAYMVENKNRVLSREQIYDAIWGMNEIGDLNTVTVHLKNIRLKMDPKRQYIKTVWGAGYKFVD